ncbi:hypothetical protein D4764_03G0004640 [Takifugu flavidus]|uniref:Ig-like domain-containing protein n=1 Tax=Takifugu flavidus TaxID=433684 RepID=A0A5C6N7W1_9TELE|nr:hypothetical protein D4764_03G0004640 [Takifugu flavidus]
MLPLYGQLQVLTVEPDWSTFFTGESVKLMCDMREGKDADWQYAIRKDGQEFYPLSRLKTHMTDMTTATFYKNRSLIVTDPNQRTLMMSENAAEISIQLQSDSSYTCKLGTGDESQPIRVKVDPYRPKAELRKDAAAAGGKVTLTCSTIIPSHGWKFFWYRGKKKDSLTAQDVAFLSNDRISTSQGGVYWCRGGRGNLVYYTEYSNPIVTSAAAVTLQPSWPEIYYGEALTLWCQIEGGEDFEWIYHWIVPDATDIQSKNEHRINYATGSHNGNYMCLGQMKNTTSLTAWSPAFNLRVSNNKLKPNLTVSPSWLSSGDSVTLNCRVKYPDVGWRFYWYKAIPNLPITFYTMELLPGSSNGTEQPYFIVYGQTQTAGYSAATLSVSPDRAQHFITDTMSLTCAGDSAEWTVKRFSSFGYLTRCATWGSMTGPTCYINGESFINGVYWCETATGLFSNAVNISRSYNNTIVDFPVHPVTEGQPVTLTVSAGYRSVFCIGRNDVSASNISEQMCFTDAAEPELYLYARLLTVLGLTVLGPTVILCTIFIWRAKKCTSPSIKHQREACPPQNIQPAEAETRGSVSLSHSEVTYENIIEEQSTQNHMLQGPNGSAGDGGGAEEPKNPLELHPMLLLASSADCGARLVHFFHRNLILQHPAAILYRGETVPLRCRHRLQTDMTTATFYKNRSLIVTDPNQRTLMMSENAAEISIQLQSDSSYTCKLGTGDESQPIRVKVDPYRPKAELRKDAAAAGGKVTLTCSTIIPSHGWKFFWYRGKKKDSLTAQDVAFLSNDRISTSQGGVYWCRGGRGNLVYYTEYSNPIVTSAAAVTLQPSWPEIYYGEALTLWCRIEGGEDFEWIYHWIVPDATDIQSKNEHRINYATGSHNGNYMCLGQMKNTTSSTAWSPAFNLRVSNNKLKPNLTVSPSWLSSGDSVTLNCRVKYPDVGWRFYWYKAIPNLPITFYTMELLPGSSNGTEQPYFIVYGQTQTAGYVCKAARGNPQSFTYNSEVKFVWSGAEWTVKRFSSFGYLTRCATWGSMTGPTCYINGESFINGVYWCETATGLFSNAVNISGT